MTFKVLIADDNKFNTIALKGQLMQSGIRDEDITIARDGVQAVACAQNQRFTVIFMDYEMPYMNGIEATKAIKAFDSHVSIIGFSTREPVEETSREFKEAGATQFLRKPARHTVIRELLKTMTPDEKKGEDDRLPSNLWAGSAGALPPSCIII
jgi:CheY-like chemotaxis protein